MYLARQLLPVDYCGGSLIEWCELPGSSYKLDGEMACLVLGIILLIRFMLYCIQVDVLFEEDKGFWSALESFAESSKRPIVLTSVG